MIYMNVARSYTANIRTASYILSSAIADLLSQCATLHDKVIKIL